jgi:hypothetical protein
MKTGRKLAREQARKRAYRDALAKLVGYTHAYLDDPGPIGEHLVCEALREADGLLTAAGPEGERDG